MISSTSNTNNKAVSIKTLIAPPVLDKRNCNGECRMILRLIKIIAAATIPVKKRIVSLVIFSLSESRYSSINVCRNVLFFMIRLCRILSHFLLFLLQCNYAFDFQFFGKYKKSHSTKKETSHFWKVSSSNHLQIL